MRSNEFNGVKVLFLAVVSAAVLVVSSVTPASAACGARDESAFKTCKPVHYKVLPSDVKKLMKKQGCDVKTGSNYDNGYAVDLNADGSPEYAFCCTEAKHGPCGMAIFGKSAGKWKVLYDDMRIMGDNEKPCDGFVVLKKKSSEYNDICIGDGPETMRFKNGKYDLEEK